VELAGNGTEQQEGEIRMFPGCTLSDMRARQADLLREENAGRRSRVTRSGSALESWFTKVLFVLLVAWHL
jgi:hypothetical protein